MFPCYQSSVPTGHLAITHCLLLIDHFSTAGHDDHHLAKIRELITDQELGWIPPVLLTIESNESLPRPIGTTYW